MDLSLAFNEVLARHDVPPISPPYFDIQKLDDFLQEAYRIRSHIASLNTYLRATRQSYLSTDRPSRTRLARTSSNNSTSLPSALPRHDPSKYLTDAQRAEIDASTKLLLRELNAAINSLSDAESVRQQTQSTIALKKRARTGLGAVGRWASGGAITAKSPAEMEIEERERGVQLVREGVLWYLARQLELCGRFQGDMMEIRLGREVERSKSVLYKAQKSMPAGMQGTHEMNGGSAGGMNGSSGGKAWEGQDLEKVEEKAEQRLDPEQLQLFAQENQDMLKHYEESLDQVRHAERSLLEISELQSTIANNLTIQSEHIDQLTENTYATAENVGGGNKELKKAAERKSTARMLFYGTTAFCLTLVVWDLLI